MKLAAVRWHVYIILCSDDSLYTGITTDLRRRFDQHSAGRGARYFRGRRPVEVVYVETGHNRSSAGSRERQIKNLARSEKQSLILSGTNEINRQRDPQEPGGRTKSDPAN
jgi:putative endonuclease